MPGRQRTRRNRGYAENVFVNCPFDRQYEDFFYALFFTIYDCGFVARSALEIDDAGQVRIEKIYDVIRRSKYSIHDISRTELDPDHQLPRFNMPLELGIFLGAKEYGGPSQRQKRCLVLDTERYRYQKFCSDIAGHDIRAHEGKVSSAITRVRDWLMQWVTDGSTAPGGAAISRRYQSFLDELPAMCKLGDLDPDDLPYVDKEKMIIGWLKENPR